MVGFEFSLERSRDYKMGSCSVKDELVDEVPAAYSREVDLICIFLPKIKSISPNKNKMMKDVGFFIQHEYIHSEINKILNNNKGYDKFKCIGEDDVIYGIQGVDDVRRVCLIAAGFDNLDKLRVKEMMEDIGNW